MAEQKLEGFKIGDTRKPTVGNPKKATEAEPEPQSLGFKRIEGILEQEDPASVSTALNTLITSLEELGRNAKGNKDKAAVKKAIIAVERTADLMDYLFQTKVAMQSAPK